MSSKIAPTPKVAAAVLGGIIASALLANITLITPDLFAGLGKWSGLVYGLTITLVMGGAGWLKSEEAAVTGDPAEAPVPAASEAPIVSRPEATFPAAAVAAVFTEPVPFTPISEVPVAPVTVAPVLTPPAV